MSPVIRHWFRRTWLRELLVAALLLQALIPAGYMPGVAADGGVTLRLCSIDNLLTPAASTGIPAPQNGGDSHHAAHGWCPFAASLHLPPFSTSFIQLVATRIVVTLPAPGFMPPPSAVALRTQLPRGPPALS